MHLANLFVAFKLSHVQGMLHTPHILDFQRLKLDPNA